MPAPPASDVARALAEALPPGRLVAAAGDDRYARDESDAGSFPPDAVVLARDASDVQAVLAVARRLGVPVVPRGAGTGKSGGALAEQGGIVLSLERMDRIRSIRPEDGVAECEPGVVTGLFQETLEERGWFYAPDPSSLALCTLGGNVAHNAGGPRALRYGVTRDWVLGLEAVLASGEVVHTGRRTLKGVAGYDLTGLLVGSEGTLAVVTGVVLRIVPLPRRVETCFATFQSPARAVAACARIFAAGVLPRALELFDRPALEAVAPGAAFSIPGAAGAALLCEVDGDGDDCLALMARIGEALRAEGSDEPRVAQNAAQRRALWDARRRVSQALRRVRPHKISEDVVVPRSRLAELVERVSALAAERGVPSACYGHAGDGNLHVNLLHGTPDERAAAEEAAEGVVRAALELGGTITGEHGVGLSKRRFLPLEHEPPVLELQRRLKDAFDPTGVLNPGKILGGRSHAGC